MNKRGARHIETILSIILFIAVVGVALTFFSPQRTDRLADNVLEYSFNEVVKNSTVEVTEVNVKVDYSGVDPGNCPGNSGGSNGKSCDSSSSDNANKKYLEVELGINSAGSSHVVNIQDTGTLIPGQVFASRVDDSDPDNTVIRVKTLGSEFFKIAVSEGVTAGDFGESGSPIGGATVELGVIRKSEAVSVNYLENLKLIYEDVDNDGYESLKTEFNLPNRIDFSFRYIEDGGSLEIKPAAEIPENLEIYRKSERIEIIDENGELKFGTLEVTVW